MSDFRSESDFSQRILGEHERDEPPRRLTVPEYFEAMRARLGPRSARVKRGQIEGLATDSEASRQLAREQVAEWDAKQRPKFMGDGAISDDAQLADPPGDGVSEATTSPTYEETNEGETDDAAAH